MYKVFFKESCFLLTDRQNLLQEGNISWIHRDFNRTKEFICRQLEESQPFKAVLFHEDPEELFSIFKSCFIYVKAAGGAVIQDNQLLVIKRLGMYDLPKGHWEHGETLEQCAIREVQEECGIQEVSIKASLTNTLHIYYRDSNWFLKKTYWYTMSAPAGQTLHPQTEEDIEEVFWFPLPEIGSILKKTYPSLQNVFQLAKDQK